MKFRKLSRWQWNELYDKLYDAAQKIFDKHKPCKIETGKCTAGDFCCHGCKHLSKKGCKVKSLVCKVWTCYSCRDNLSDIELKRLIKIRKISEIFEMGMLRHSKAESYKQYQSYLKWRQKNEQDNQS